MNNVIIPVVTYSPSPTTTYGAYNDFQKDIVGVFSNQTKAEDAVKNFIEGFLEIEKAPYEIQDISYQTNTIDECMV